METTLRRFMESTNQRFTDMNLRFAELREDMNLRFAELREDMNKRFEQVDKRFEQMQAAMDKRFEQVDKRFEQMMLTMQLLAALFTALVIAVLGYAWWDRRTIISKVFNDGIRSKFSAKWALFLVSLELRLVELSISMATTSRNQESLITTSIYQKYKVIQ